MDHLKTTFHPKKYVLNTPACNSPPLNRKFLFSSKGKLKNSIAVCSISNPWLFTMKNPHSIHALTTSLLRRFVFCPEKSVKGKCNDSTWHRFSYSCNESPK
ncbi:hypothetical protein SOMG_04071 [Schizosaccharomyces osmophilus]|uniref:Uncharacterized protein n=1 Tax=Schizosaccharomyces osmophilus TaxID=2545709 RepID=A0AAE9WCC8_9SCHI|nr:uncharacterized protein SOMG_04071 [Schizosaccharomyces osmophilus]WBW73721.1 hypothetical protein SOMG_04071 [Schizosaccharomyces osmophilus]